MTTETVSIASISPDPANARRHDARNLSAIAASLRRFGQQKPIVVDSHGVVRAGNGTLEAAKSLGWTEIAIVRSDLPLAELTAYAIADNRTAELATWDDEFLAAALSDPLLGDVGFDADEIDKLLQGKQPPKDDDDSPEPSSDNPLLEGAWQVVVECGDEAEQKSVFEELTAQGRTCRLFTL